MHFVRNVHDDKWYMPQKFGKGGLVWPNNYSFVSLRWVHFMSKFATFYSCSSSIEDHQSVTLVISFQLQPVRHHCQFCCYWTLLNDYQVEIAALVFLRMNHASSNQICTACTSGQFGSSLQLATNNEHLVGESARWALRVIVGNWTGATSTE